VIFYSSVFLLINSQEIYDSLLICISIDKFRRYLCYFILIKNFAVFIYFIIIGTMKPIRIGYVLHLNGHIWKL